MSRPDSQQVDVLIVSKQLSPDEIGPHLRDLAAMLTAGDGGSALAGLVLTEHAFQRSDIVCASEKLCALDEFDDAERLVADALRRFPSDITLCTEYARIAERNKNHAEAAARFRTFRIADPQLAVAHLGEAVNLRDDGRFDEAATLLDQAVERFPDDLAIAATRAELTAKRGLVCEALEQWSHLRARFPHSPLGFVRAAKLLRDQGDYRGGEELLEQAFRAFPSDMGVLTDYAWLAHLRDDFAEAEARWLRVRRAHPDLEAGYIQGARNAIASGRTEVAEALLEEATARFPDSPNPRAELALLATRLNRWHEAADRWQGVREHAPNDVTALIESMKALRQLGRVQEADILAVAAEAATSAACEQSPDDVGMFRRHAILAEDRQDWVEAVRRWSDIGSRFGENVSAHLHDLRVKTLDQEIELAQQAGGDLANLLQYRHHDADDDQNRAVMMTFESLGGIMTGCEFGAVQRAYGAEPLGLLRWSGMAMHSLAEMLERRFERMGDPEKTAIEYYDHGDRREYAIKDLTFGTSMHSHIFVDQMDEPSVFRQVTKRMQFLRRKILDDLTRRDKIFLFKNSVREPLPDETDRLAAAMRSYGPSLLLIVASANDAAPNGTLKILRDNVWLGHVAFSNEFGEQSAERWLQLCRTAYEQFIMQPAPSP